MDEPPRTRQQAERRALVADLVRTQATLQARSEQLQAIFASRWYRFARFTWRLRQGAILRKADPPRMAGEESFARPLVAHRDRIHFSSPSATANNGDAVVESHSPNAPVVPKPMPNLERPRETADLTQGKRLLLAGHSLSFCEEIARRARAAHAAVREDRWLTHRDHDEDASAAALAWADVVHCEWCLGNAVWYSNNKLPGQRLVVRFHRMELETSYPGQVNMDQVDAMVFVARHVLEAACERWGWDPKDPRIHVVPNGIDLRPPSSPKPPEARFTLATIGYVPQLKRLDLALDILELLRRQDDRYRLLVKGREPWEYPWMAGRHEERSYYDDLSERLEQTPGLRKAVRFEPFGEDVSAFLRQAGWILSTSEIEGHSVSLAEGMMSGAIPVVIARPGAAQQYRDSWVHTDPAAAAHTILTTQERGETQSQEEMAARAAERWSWRRLGPVWDHLLLNSGVEASAPNQV